MHNKNDRIAYLLSLHDEYNEESFDGKLLPIKIMMKKGTYADGYYEYQTQKRDGDNSGWLPVRCRLHKAYIVINDECFNEDSVEGTLLHEMVHQYQCEVLDRTASHDAIFCSMARRLAKKYNVSVE